MCPLLFVLFLDYAFGTVLSRGEYESLRRRKDILRDRKASKNKDLHRCWTAPHGKKKSIEECKLPFIYEKKWYRTCTVDGTMSGRDMWCPTKLKPGGKGEIAEWRKHIGKTWYYCGRCNGTILPPLPKNDKRPVVLGPSDRNTSRPMQNDAKAKPVGEEAKKKKKADKKKETKGKEKKTSTTATTPKATPKATPKVTPKVTPKAKKDEESTTTPPTATAKPKKSKDPKAKKKNKVDSTLKKILHAAGGKEEQPKRTKKPIVGGDNPTDDDGPEGVGGGEPSVVTGSPKKKSVMTGPGGTKEITKHIPGTKGRPGAKGSKRPGMNLLGGKPKPKPKGGGKKGGRKIIEKEGKDDVDPKPKEGKDLPPKSDAKETLEEDIPGSEGKPKRSKKGTKPGAEQAKPKRKGLKPKDEPNEEPGGGPQTNGIGVQEILSKDSPVKEGEGKDTPAAPGVKGTEPKPKKGGEEDELDTGTTEEAKPDTKAGGGEKGGAGHDAPKILPKGKLSEPNVKKMAAVGNKTLQQEEGEGKYDINKIMEAGEKTLEAEGEDPLGHGALNPEEKARWKKRHPGGVKKKRPAGIKKKHPRGSKKKHPGSNKKKLPGSSKKKFPGGGKKEILGPEVNVHDVGQLAESGQLEKIDQEEKKEEKAEKKRKHPGGTKKKHPGGKTTIPRGGWKKTPTTFAPTAEGLESHTTSTEPLYPATNKMPQKPFKSSYGTPKPVKVSPIQHFVTMIPPFIQHYITMIPPFIGLDGEHGGAILIRESIDRDEGQSAESEPKLEFSNKPKKGKEDVPGDIPGPGPKESEPGTQAKKEVGKEGLESSGPKSKPRGSTPGGTKAKKEFGKAGPERDTEEKGEDGLDSPQVPEAKAKGKKKHPGGAKKKHPGGVKKKYPGGAKKKHPGGVKKKHPGGAKKKHPGGVKKKHPGGAKKKHPGGVKKKYPGGSMKKKRPEGGKKKFPIKTTLVPIAEGQENRTLTTPHHLGTNGTPSKIVKRSRATKKPPKASVQHRITMTPPLSGLDGEYVATILMGKPTEGDEDQPEPELEGSGKGPGQPLPPEPGRNKKANPTNTKGKKTHPGSAKEGNEDSKSPKAKQEPLSFDEAFAPAGAKPEAASPKPVGEPPEGQKKPEKVPEPTPPPAVELDLDKEPQSSPGDEEEECAATDSQGNEKKKKVYVIKLRFSRKEGKGKEEDSASAAAPGAPQIRNRQENSDEEEEKATATEADWTSE